MCQHALGYLLIKCNGMLPARFLESSAGISKYKQNNEYKKIYIFHYFIPLPLTRMAIGCQALLSMGFSRHGY